MALSAAILRALSAARTVAAMPQIAVQDLSKTHSKAERQSGLLGVARGLFNRRCRCIEALKGVIFSIERDEFVGVIGPHGAGKSNLIEISATFSSRRRARARRMGLIPWATASVT